MRKYIVGLFFLALASCQVDDFETPEYRSKIVVDGWIEQGQPARVFLTLSTPYFSEVDSATLRKLVLTHAKVSVTDGINSEVLTLKSNFDYFPPYLYESNVLTGEIGHSYNLKVEYGGVVVTSSTQIITQPNIDSVWFQEKKLNDSLGFLMLQFTDRIGVDDYYRIFAKRTKDKDFIPVQLPNLNGKLIDGKTVDVPVYRGRNDLLISNELLYFKKGDTVSLKFCSVDNLVFDFWYSLQSELINSQNPFASNNSHVKSNVFGGLGVWSGYGASYKRIICK